MCHHAARPNERLREWGRNTIQVRSCFVSRFVVQAHERLAHDRPPRDYCPYEWRSDDLNVHLDKSFSPGVKERFSLMGMMLCDVEFRRCHLGVSFGRVALGDRRITSATSTCDTPFSRCTSSAATVGFGLRTILPKGHAAIVRRSEEESRGESRVRPENW
jgi:hypothetical protein